MKIKVGKVKLGLGHLISFLFGGLMVVLIWGGSYFMSEQQVNLVHDKSGVTIKWLPDTVIHWRAEIEKQAERYNVNANLIAILMTLESGGYSRADSGQANGLMQVTPYTAKDIAKKFLKEPRDKFDMNNPKDNIEFGVAYIAYLRNEFCGPPIEEPSSLCVEQIAAGYNGGPGAANRIYKGEGLQDTQTVIYSRNAFNMWREKDAAKSPTYERWLEAGGQSLIDKARTEQDKK